MPKKRITKKKISIKNKNSNKVIVNINTNKSSNKKPTRKPQIIQQSPPLSHIQTLIVERTPQEDYDKTKKLINNAVKENVISNVDNVKNYIKSIVPQAKVPEPIIEPVKRKVKIKKLLPVPKSKKVKIKKILPIQETPINFKPSKEAIETPLPPSDNEETQSKIIRIRKPKGKTGSQKDARQSLLEEYHSLGGQNPLINVSARKKDIEKAINELKKYMRMKEHLNSRPLQDLTPRAGDSLGNASGGLINDRPRDNDLYGVYSDPVPNISV